MWRFIVGLLATIGFLAILFMVALGFAVSRFLPEREPLPPRILLTADWTRELTEVAAAPNLLDLELTPRQTVSEVVLALDAAAGDRRVAGLLVRLAETSHGFAVAQELRDAIGRFRASGKFAIAYADSFGELNSGNEGYYIATGFEQIVLQPIGLVGLTGLSAQIPLARELLASLGVSFEISRRAEYKTALESLTESELSRPNRVQIEALLDALTNQLVAGIAAARRLKPEKVRQLIDRGPFTDREARAAGLIDNILHYDEARLGALRRAGQEADAVALAAYADQVAQSVPGAPKVALVRASGLIRRGEDAIGVEIASRDLAGTLEDAARDRTIRAVVLRVDSGGGSAVASETIARAVRRVRDAGKPLIVSMSNAAASGGYWIAMDATRIVAQPGTITGSIGVIAGKPVLEAAWTRLGVNWAEISRGAHADLWSVNAPYSPEGRARVDAIVGSLYEAFTSGVARGRDLAPERVREIAKGRVWAGADALGIGLVDELGGLDTALAAVRRALQLPPEAELEVELHPEDGGPLAVLWRRLRSGAAGLEALLGLVQQLRAFAGTALSLPVAIR